MGARTKSRLRIIIEENWDSSNKLNDFITCDMKAINLIHPGEILEEEFLKPMDITQYKLANALAVPRRRINEIVHGERAVSADTALRLAEYFGTSAEFWLNLQSRYDLLKERQSSGASIRKVVKRREAVFA